MKKNLYCYDYTNCMMMKLGMAYPEKDGSKSHVLMNFEQALDAVKKIDHITQGITKIYYLVGWQYLGHDDKYPDFFEVNAALKRPQDKTARDSFIWLYQEAKKYNSVISVHINFNDAYDNAPSFPDFVKAGALIRKKNGKIHAIEKYNGRACYKTDHKAYWESGLFKRQFNRLLDTLPFLSEAKTIHVDNFQCYKNYAPDVSIKEMQAGRRKMIEYVREKGIDITSEFTYKETEDLPNRPFLGLPREHHHSAPMDTVGLIPASWWCYRMTRKEIIDTPPQIYSGGIFRNKRYRNYLYGNMHGEDIIKPQNQNWVQDFIHDFATVQVPYHFLCRHKRLAIKGFGVNERCEFSDGIISYNQGGRIVQNGNVLKDGDDLCLPFVHQENCSIAYSRNGCNRVWNTINGKYSKAKLFQITEKGNVFLKEIPVFNGRLSLKVDPGSAILICFEE